MAEFTELVQALTWLLTNRIQQKIDYVHGLLGDGNGRVRVSTIPGSPEVDYVFVRPDRFSNRSFKVFNKRIEGQDGDPIIIGELPWEPGLVQVVDMDWAAYADVGWGDDVSTTNRHGISHQWRDGAPGIDTFNVYRRQFGDLKTYATVSGTLNVGVSPYSLDLFGKQYQWPGTQDFDLGGALPTTTGTARMALVFWSPASGTTQGFLGVATGTLGGDSEATILNRPVSPQGVIPSAFVRLAGGQSSITEFDIWDAREPFRPGLSFSTGTAGLSADMIPISDVVGFYTGSTVEAALAEVPYKLIAPDGGINPVLSADIAGDVTLAGTGTFAIPLHLAHVGDPDTRLTFTDDDIEATVGGLSMLKLTKAGQNVVAIGSATDTDVNFNAGQMFLQGSTGRFGIGTVLPGAALNVVGQLFVDAGTANISVRLTSTDTLAAMSFSDNVTATATATAVGALGTDMILRVGDATRVSINDTGSMFVGNGDSPTINARLHVLDEDAVTAAVTDVEILGHNSSGTPAANFGAGLLYQLESSTTINQDAARISALWATATHATRKARSVWSVFDTAEREAVRIEASGSAPMVGFYGVSAVVRPTALTSPLTQITHTGPAVPDFAIATPIDSGVGSAWGFSTQDEFETIMSVILNLQTRLDEAETKLQSLGLLT